MNSAEHYASLLQSVNAKKTFDQYFECGLIEISLSEMRGGNVIQLDGYNRSEFLERDVSIESFKAKIADMQAHAETFVGINTTLAQYVVEQYKDAPYDLTIEQNGVETKVSVTVRAQNVELSLRNSPIFNEGHVMYFRIRRMENGELFLIASSGRVTRRRSIILKYDPVVERQRFLDEVMPWFEQRHDGLLRRCTVSYPHSLTGEHQTRIEWYEVYPHDEVDKAILGFRNCKVMMVDAVKIQQVTTRDLFGAVKGLYDYHLHKDITETVFAFRLPDDFEPNGREFAEMQMLAPVCVG